MPRHNRHIKGMLSGDKFNGRHSTVIPGAEDAVGAAKACKHVTKIGLGIVHPTGGGTKRLKFTAVGGALKMQVRGDTAVQIFWVYTTKPAETIKEIMEKWAK